MYLDPDIYSEMFFVLINIAYSILRVLLFEE